ncbi:glycosyltransferase [Paenibacillus sp. LHD-117]|uniref:glycosyltransferase n=1 Tax=Paenibacillus sp. LHD-117 TaxID=3071412 RepID=UPI0027E062D2|nr:glycosyltransferase [Paenibacillus sp. LHD-117]MDQ6422467.1 glycosyltransferase [Paenibacillus sp. LHD-117]
MTFRPLRKPANNKLTAMMQVRNEENRYFEEVLDHLTGFADEIVIVDDASSDRTVDICRRYPKVVKLVELTESKFREEWKLRQLLWEAAAATDPDWLLAIDADEIYEDKTKHRIHELINQDRYDWVGFRFYDFWGGTTYYREDEYWNIHKRHTMTLVRYLPEYHYFYPKREHHVSRLPLSCGALPGHGSELRVKHYGWAGGEEERHRKYVRYMEMDPEGKWGSLEHYRSILDPDPHLVEWKEEP